MAFARYILLMLAVALVLAACEPAEDPAAVPPDDVDRAEVEDFEPATEGQAPMLAELVEAGELPPLEERLPEDPLVVEPLESVGQYGGTWTTAVLGPADDAWFPRTVGYDQLMRWNPEVSDTIPNVAEDIEVNEDATEFTVHLREGIRWSDGEPFDADDVMFWYEGYMLNEQLSPEPPTWMVTGDEIGTVERVDDHTVRFTFTEPNGLIPWRLAMPGNANKAGTTTPRHYLEQFHADYNPDVDQLVEEEGFADWMELFEFRAGFEQQAVRPGLPTLNPWVMQTDLGEGATVTFERNPYYWKVDTAGNQLPYIDRVVFNVVEDEEVLVFQTINGELDFHARHIFTVANRPLIAENAEAGDYRLLRERSTGMNTMMIGLNLTHPDEVLREVFNNKDFRIGLSHAINRQEIIDVVYTEQGQPHQGAPRPDSEYYHEQLATQYTEYDVDLANEHLDAAGYDERDGEGYRLGPDGQRIAFNVDVTADQSDRIDQLELIEGYWREVGIDMRINTMDRSLLYIRKEDNDHDAAVWGGDGGGAQTVILDPRWYVPISDESIFAVAWAYWWLGDPRGEEPPEATQRQHELYDQVLATSDLDEQHELMMEILDIAAEEFYTMGTSLPTDDYGIARNHFRNVPDEYLSAWQAVTPAPTNPETYFILQDQ